MEKRYLQNCEQFYELGKCEKCPFGVDSVFCTITQSFFKEDRFIDIINHTKENIDKINEKMEE